MAAKIATGVKIQVTRHDGVTVSFAIEGPVDHAWRSMMLEKCQSIVDNQMMHTPTEILETARKLNMMVVEVVMFDQGACGDYASLVQA